MPKKVANLAAAGYKRAKLADNGFSMRPNKVTETAIGKALDRRELRLELQDIEREIDAEALIS